MGLLKKFCFLFLLPIFWAGCAATDVGNPTIPAGAEPASEQAGEAPSAADLIGSFEQEAAEAEDVADSTTPCQSDSDAAKQILAAENPGQIILENFLNYSASTVQITADYDEDEGLIDFAVADDSADLVCEGTAAEILGGAITITLECDVVFPVDHVCTIEFLKAQ